MLCPLNVHQVRREVLVHSSLAHENILPLYAAFEDDASVFLVLEFCAKGDLYGYLRSKGRALSEAQVRRRFRFLRRTGRSAPAASGPRAGVMAYSCSFLIKSLRCEGPRAGVPPRALHEAVDREHCRRRWHSVPSRRERLAHHP